MSKQTLNLGTAPAGADGDTVRAAFVKVEANTAELYTWLGASGSPAALPTSLPVARAFSRATALGTVSQTSGVPTGALMERGSNANGEYEKYACGTLICRLNSQVGIGLTVQNGYAYYNATAWTFPIAFVGAFPYVSLSAYISGRITVTSMASVALANSAFNLLDFAGSNTGAYNLEWFAIGRWY